MVLITGLKWKLCAVTSSPIVSHVEKLIESTAEQKGKPRWSPPWIPQDHMVLGGTAVGVWRLILMNHPWYLQGDWRPAGNLAPGQGCWRQGALSVCPSLTGHGTLGRVSCFSCLWILVSGAKSINNNRNKASDSITFYEVPPVERCYAKCIAYVISFDPSRNWEISFVFVLQIKKQAQRSWLFSGTEHSRWQSWNSNHFLSL
jgi:hypothetical protein